MLTELLASLLSFLISGWVDLVTYVLPAPLESAWDSGLAMFATIFSFVPAAAFGYLLLSWFAFDTLLNTYDFAVNTYRLLPAKFT